MNSSLLPLVLFVVGLLVGLYAQTLLQKDHFQNYSSCDSCGQESPCGCDKPMPKKRRHHSDDSMWPSWSNKSNSTSNATNTNDVSRPAPECKQPNMSNYVLKSSIPPCPAVPDLSNYILKSECPPVPDLSNYVLKSSIPKQNPVILDCSKCQKGSGECPPCPRPRCPEVKCPPATKCPSCPPCARTRCPPAVVKCKAEETVSDSFVRPYLAPLSYKGFGSD